jgi:hypothetical protein
MNAFSLTIFKDPEDELLGHVSHDEDRKGTDHAVRTAPVFTRAALDLVGEDILPQRALYGSIIAQRSSSFPENLDKKDAKLYINTNAPFSGVVCGVQVCRTFSCLIYTANSLHVHRDLAKVILPQFSWRGVSCETLALVHFPLLLRV